MTCGEVPVALKARIAYPRQMWVDQYYRSGFVNLLIAVHLIDVLLSNPKIGLSLVQTLPLRIENNDVLSAMKMHVWFRMKQALIILVPHQAPLGTLRL